MKVRPPYRGETEWNREIMLKFYKRSLGFVRFIYPNWWRVNFNLPIKITEGK